MPMIAVSIALLFALSAIAAFAVLGMSYRRAFVAFGELRRALALCEDRRTFLLRVEDMELARRPVPVTLRLVGAGSGGSAGSGSTRRPVPQPGLRAAA